MKFRKPKKSEWKSTWLQSCVEVDYGTLVKTFGKPKGGDGYKTDAEWELVFEDGTFATIYNYKDGKNYNGKAGTATTKITDWHIGGCDKRAVELVCEALGMSADKSC